jgi:DNA-directed RNA polymerase subunit RPC12/RpoP
MTTLSCVDCGQALTYATTIYGQDTLSIAIGDYIICHHCGTLMVATIAGLKSFDEKLLSTEQRSLVRDTRLKLRPN